METKTTTKQNVNQMVTDRIIALLQKMIIPWRQPWERAGLPANLITKRPYRGINVMLLNTLGYDKNFFITAKQLKELDARVKKGEKGNIAIYWQWPDKSKKPTEEDGQPKAPTLRYFTVFNIVQCEGIPDSLLPAVTKNNLPIDACQEVIEAMANKPYIVHNEKTASYNPLTDEINIPDIGQFNSDEGYYLTLFHQLIHSTGRWTRLNRMGLLEMKEWTSHPFSFEELVADIGSAYLSFHCGLELVPGPDADYIDGWLIRLKHDNRILVQAASAAQKAVDYILNVDRSDYEILE